MGIGDKIETLAESIGLPSRGVPTDKRMEALGKVIASLEDVQGLNDHPGWISILGPFNDGLKALDREIHELSRRPVKNEKKLIWLNALYETQTKFLAIFERNLRHYKGLMAEYERLKLDAENMKG